MTDATNATAATVARPGRSRLAQARHLTLVAIGAAVVALSLAARTAAAQQRDTVARDTTRSAVPHRPGADTTRAPATARDTTRRSARGRPRRQPAGVAVPDSVVRPPISPRRAFLYSLLVPGEGQTALRRPRAAALFATIEFGSIAMIAKSKNDLRIARARPDTVTTIDIDPLSGDTIGITKVPDRLKARVRARRLHVEDWMATLLFNHLFAGADAFVAAQLWDLPAEVSFQAMPRGGAVVVRLPW